MKLAPANHMDPPGSYEPQNADQQRPNRHIGRPCDSVLVAEACAFSIVLRLQASKLLSECLISHQPRDARDCCCSDSTDCTFLHV